MDIDKTDSRALSQLLDLDAQGGTSWTEKELSGILAHQLAAPLVVDLKSLAPDIEEQLQQINTDQETPIETFADVLFHPLTPQPLTVLIKEFAKQQRDAGDLSEEIISLLYVAAICASLTHEDRSISSLDDATLLKNIQQLLAFSWLDERLHALLEKTGQALEAKT